jgi:hypothetical protein
VETNMPVTTNYKDEHSTAHGHPNNRGMALICKCFAEVKARWTSQASTFQRASIYRSFKTVQNRNKKTATNT